MAERALPFSGTLVVYPEGVDKPGEEIWCRDGFVSRVVSAVAGENISDAREVAKKLNRYDDMIVVLKALYEDLSFSGCAPEDAPKLLQIIAQKHTASLRELINQVEGRRMTLTAAIRMVQSYADIKALNSEMLEALKGLYALTSDSARVAGYHLNGDVAEWEEFPEVATAAAVIAKAEGRS
jgi:hypothetical protein